MLQMGTALRPLVGTSERLLPDERRFFLVHWFETLGDGVAPREPFGR